ncbi:hypothetical protein AVEN_175606-1 [Araneus ventricosus]|uniref:Uncharacterized protein n=1 Tax=Araneus ventricosus TaxID=182803 RepID=A0A4Y2G2D0_ARAVE|nr:hypothetical protein AVEN_175606-1 [Araneus ventricosus]
MTSGDSLHRHSHCEPWLIDEDLTLDARHFSQHPPLIIFEPHMWEEVSLRRISHAPDSQTWQILVGMCFEPVDLRFRSEDSGTRLLYNVILNYYFSDNSNKYHMFFGKTVLSKNCSTPIAPDRLHIFINCIEKSKWNSLKVAAFK